MLSIIHAAMVDTLLKTFNFGRESCRILMKLQMIPMMLKHCPNLSQDHGLIYVNMGSYCTNIAKDACSIFDAGLGKFDVAVVCHEAGPDFDHISSLRLIGSLVASSNSHSWSGLDKGTLREHAAW